MSRGRRAAVRAAIVAQLVVAAAIVVQLIVASTSFAAVSPTVTPANELVLSGRLATSEASGILRLEAPSEATEVLLSASGLRLMASPSDPEGPATPEPSPSPIDELPATAVSFSSATVTLVPGKPVDVIVTVKGFRYAGTYSGTISVEYASPPAAPSPPAPAAPYQFVDLPDPIRLTVNVTADPSIALAVGSAPVKIVKTKCFEFGECWLAGLWADDAELHDTTNVDLRNSGQAPGRLASLDWTITNRSTRTAPVASPVAVTMESEPLPPGGIGTMDVTVKRANLDPGIYDGLITYVTDGVPGSTAVTYELTVRQHPIWLAIWIALGWLLVLILTGLRTAASEARVAGDGKASLTKLRSDYPAEVQYVEGRLRELEAKNRWTPKDQDKANAIANDMQSLDIVSKLEQEIGEDPRFDETRTAIDNTRDFARRARSKETVEAANEAIKARNRERQEAERILLDQTASRESRELGLPPLTLDIWPAIWSIISPRIEGRVITLAWAVVRVGVFVALIVLGLKLAYLDTAGFTGAAPKDWLVLVTYGSGADVFSRYLSGFVPRPS